MKPGGQVLEREDPDSIALHECLEIWSFVPYANYVAIPANALLYAHEGDYLNAVTLGAGFSKVCVERETFNRSGGKFDEAGKAYNKIDVSILCQQVEVIRV